MTAAMVGVASHFRPDGILPLCCCLSVTPLAPNQLSHLGVDSILKTVVIMKPRPLEAYMGYICAGTVLLFIDGSQVGPT